MLNKQSNTYAFILHILIIAFACNGKKDNEIVEVKIGGQTWSKNNLDVGVFRNGEAIPEAKTEEEWGLAGKEKRAAWCYYEFNPKNGETYGKLYNWFTVNDPRGLAPNGWHVPSNEEFDRLINFAGGKKEAGFKLKSQSGWRDNGNGNDQYGFAGLPAGQMTGTFNHFGDMGANSFWWSTTPLKYGGENGAYHMMFNNTNGYVSTDFSSDKENGFSVRLIKD